ncbi:MAG: 5-(carboxyamino)imidazole ribonucleotide mutase [Deltaproteobacteria bacterium]
MAKVGIILGSDSDLEVMNEACKALEELEIGYELRVASAHRTPHKVKEYVEAAEGRGIEILIAGAGWAAHLPGVVAAYTTLPVIGVPVDSSPLKGMDSLLSIVQMPPGIPVATMAIGKGGARNAAIYAASILGLQYPDIRERVKDFRRKLAEKVEAAAKKVDR